MVGIPVSFWDGLFSGAMLVSGSVDFVSLHNCQSPTVHEPNKTSPETGCLRFEFGMFFRTEKGRGEGDPGTRSQTKHFISSNQRVSLIESSHLFFNHAFVENMGSEHDGFVVECKKCGLG